MMDTIYDMFNSMIHNSFKRKMIEVRIGEEGTYEQTLDVATLKLNLVCGLELEIE